MPVLIVHIAPAEGGRGDEKLGVGGGTPIVPTGPLGQAPAPAPMTELRGLCQLCPVRTAPRRPGRSTTSSSSAARAADPSIPFGLGERREGDVAPDPEPDAFVSAAVDGRAIGAIGRVMGPGSAAAADGLRTAMGATCGNIPAAGVTSELGNVTFGGPI